jgi:hypothetical protein
MLISRPIDPASITLARVASLRESAMETGSRRAWRAYTECRAAYRQWTLQRLAKIEADDESEY